MENKSEKLIKSIEYSKFLFIKKSKINFCYCIHHRKCTKSVKKNLMFCDRRNKKIVVNKIIQGHFFCENMFKNNLFNMMDVKKTMTWLD